MRKGARRASRDPAGAGGSGNGLRCCFTAGGMKQPVFAFYALFRGVLLEIERHAWGYRPVVNALQHLCCVASASMRACLSDPVQGCVMDNCSTSVSVWLCLVLFGESQPEPLKPKMKLQTHMLRGLACGICLRAHAWLRGPSAARTQTRTTNLPKCRHRPGFAVAAGCRAIVRRTRYMIVNAWANEWGWILLWMWKPYDR